MAPRIFAWSCLADVAEARARRYLLRFRFKAGQFALTFAAMCGRVFVKSGPDELLRAFSFARPGEPAALGNLQPRYNGSPGLDYPIIVREPDTAGGMFMRARWGFIPRWMKDPRGGRKPVNAKAEGVAANGMFKAAYRARRALMPVNGYFEWRSTRGARQPYAIAMKSGAPFALAAIWESWRNPETGEDMKTFAVITCQANALVAEIHDRMPVVIAPDDYRRWLGEETDPADLMAPFPAGLMTMWPVSTRVNAVRNDDPDILNPFQEPDLFD